MEIRLSADHRALIEDLVSTGKYTSAEEVVSAALHLLLNRECLKHQIDVGIAEADQGDLLDHDTVYAQLRDLAACAKD